MTNDDLLFRHRQQPFARAREVGVRRACAELGYHHSTYYYWLPLVERQGLEILRPRERRRPRMPNETPQWLEQRVLAFALAFPGLGPGRVAAQLRQTGWGGLRVSPSGDYKVLRRHGLSTRRRRLWLVAGYSGAPPLERDEPLEPRHIEAESPAGSGSTPQSTGHPSSGRRSRLSAPSNASFAPAAHRPTASSNGPSEQSWKSVGGRASPARLRLSQQLSEETSTSTSSTTTSSSHRAADQGPTAR